MFFLRDIRACQTESGHVDDTYPREPAKLFPFPTVPSSEFTLHTHTRETERALQAVAWIYWIAPGRYMSTRLTLACPEYTPTADFHHTPSGGGTMGGGRLGYIGGGEAL